MTINNTLKAIRSSGELPFKDVLSPEMIKIHIEPIPCRQRVFTPDMTIFTFLSQVISVDKSCQGALSVVIAHLLWKGEKVPSYNTSAYVQARGRLPEESLSGLARECAKEMERQAPKNILWRERHVKLIDGSTLSMPDTKKNQEIYPQTDRQKKGIGFPIMRVVAVISLGLGAVLDLAMGPYAGKGTGEHGLLRELMHNFNKGDIVLGDRYYASYFLIATLMSLGVDAVFPIHRARGCDFRRGKGLGKKDHEVEWKKPARPEWMDKETYEGYPQFIKVRETSVSNKAKGFKAEKRILVSTFLEPTEVSKEALGDLYNFRWLIEVNFKAIKDTMQMGVLRSKSPEMVRKEIWAHILAYNLIRKIMAQAAVRYDKRPQNLSFKGAMQIISVFRQAGSLSESNNVIYNEILYAIASKEVGNRPGRCEPRKIKRRPKSYPYLQKSRASYHKKKAA